MVIFGIGSVVMKDCLEVSGIKYDLSHLVPFEFEVDIPGKIKGHRLNVNLVVSFSNHCYTSKYDKEQTGFVLFDDRREKRFFSIERYFLSEDLPEQVKRLGTTEKCFFASSRNYFMATARDGNEYRVFFSVKKLNAKSIRLFIESAYVPDTVERKKRHSVKGILLLAKTLRGEKIKNPSK